MRQQLGIGLPCLSSQYFISSASYFLGMGPVAIIRDRPASRSSKLRRRQARGLLEGMQASFVQGHFVRLLFVDLEQVRLLGGEAHRLLVFVGSV